jgi:hypothetical protein
MAPVMGKMIERRACHWRRKGGAVGSGVRRWDPASDFCPRHRTSTCEHYPKKILETLAGARAPLHSE